MRHGLWFKTRIDRGLFVRAALVAKASQHASVAKLGP
jgi:hypothetical protein